MNSHAVSHRTIVHRRIAAAAVGLAIVVGAPAAAIAATSSSGSGVVHEQVQRSGAVIVSGYDGGVPLAPANRQP